MRHKPPKMVLTSSTNFPIFYIVFFSVYEFLKEWQGSFVVGGVLFLINKKNLN